MGAQKDKVDLNDNSTGAFKDNTTKDITPEDIRDLVESMQLSHGSVYFSTAIETSIAAADTFVKAAGTTTAEDVYRMTTAVANRIVYTGTKDVHAEVTVTFSMTTAGNNKEIDFGIYHYDDSAASGSVVTGSKIRRKIGTGADLGAASTSASIDLEEDDYVEFWVANHTDDTNVTIELGRMHVQCAFA